MKFCFKKKDFIEYDIAPNKLAVIGEYSELTWLEFSQKVNELVALFIKEGINTIKAPVIVYGHKRADMLVAFYALIKLEIPYIPVDKIYPSERISKIIETVGSQLVINTTDSNLEEFNVNQIQLRDNEVKHIKAIDYTLETIKNEDPIVYIIFTSGSTGAPKGVQISTEAVLSFTKWMGSEDFNFTSLDVFINIALLSFDLSVYEVMSFGHLGATIMLNSSQQSSDPSILMERIEQYKASVWVSTPSFALTYARIKDTDKFKSIHSFLFCGEVLPNVLVKKLLKNYPFAKVINSYGPTEATVATTVVEITPEIVENHDPLPVGKVKEGAQILIENKEIIIVGPNVSVGYVNNPVLNQKKFTTINNQRAFRTGDQGYLENDWLYFYGREDDLVKLHGFRIELSEITGALNNVKGVLIAETIPLKRNGSTKKVISFVQLVNNYEVEVNDLKEELEKTLPHYMVPADIIFLEQFPMTVNGKIDKKELLSKFFKKS